MLWLIISVVLLPLSVLVPACPDKQRQHEHMADFWARHASRFNPAGPRKVALAALAAYGNSTWWAFLLVWPTVRVIAVGLGWTVCLVGLIIPGLAHMTLKLTRRALKAATYLFAALWCAAEWLVWHIDQLTADPGPSNAPQLATV